MSLEKHTIAVILKDRTAWSRITQHLSPESLTPYGRLVLNLASEYYEKDEKAGSVDRDVLLEVLKQRFEKSDKHRELYDDYVKQAFSMDVSSVNLVDLVLETKRHDVGNRLGAALLNKEKSAKIDELIEQYSNLAAVSKVEEDEVYEGGSLDALLEQAFDPSNRIHLLPKSLDKMLEGKTKRGHHIVIAARPETGKTAISLSIARAVALQDLRVCIFGNEEPVADTRMRMASCLTGMTAEEIRDDKAKANQLLKEKNWHNIIFIPINPGTPREITRYLEKYKPDCFIVDQIRNMNVGGETRVNQLEMAATFVRNAAKKFNALGVSITQAGDSAEGKLILTMGDIDFSNTGIPATADLMLMAGVDDNFNSQNLRMFNLPKNKISAKHAHWHVRINPTLSRIEDA